MAIRSVGMFVEGLDQVDVGSDAKRFPLGTKVFLGDQSYVYVQGVSSGAAGKWVTFTPAGVTTLLAANASGEVGLLMSALDATTDYGFAQIFGANSIASVDAVSAAGLPLYIDGTAGRADAGTDVSGDVILGAISTSAASSNVASVFLNYPMVINVAID
jgi:hypothetical protein